MKRKPFKQFVKRTSGDFLEEGEVQLARELRHKFAHNVQAIRDGTHVRFTHRKSLKPHQKCITLPLLRTNPHFEQ